MKTILTKTAPVLGLAAVIALSAAACGRMADLEPPRRETERAQRSATAPGLREPGTVNRPPSQQRIDGGPNDPFGAPAAGRDG